MPEERMKWQTAAAALSLNPPAVRLLGYFTAGQTRKASELLQVPGGRGGLKGEGPLQGWGRGGKGMQQHHLTLSHPPVLCAP